jgi:hypothetical protein
MDDYWIIEHTTDSRYVWGQWGWTDDLAAAMQFTKDDFANTPLPTAPGGALSPRANHPRNLWR